MNLENVILYCKNKKQETLMIFSTVYSAVFRLYIQYKVYTMLDVVFNG